MRILHVTPYAAEAWAYGGIPRVVGALTKTLAQRGHDVTVAATDACDAATRLGSHSPVADGVRQQVFPNLSNRLAYHQQLFLPRGLGRFLQDHVRGFDIAHVHACRNVPGLLAARYLKQAGVPYVLAPNGTAPIIERRRLAKHAFDAAFGRQVMDGAARILAVAEAERRQLLSVGVSAERIAVIPNPMDLDEFTQPVRRGYVRRLLNLPIEPLVMFLGKQTPRKRIDVLVRAFAQMRYPDAHLVIAGNDMGVGPALRKLVRELGIEQHTHFIGLLRGSERLTALADADVVVYPSDHEVFGLVPLEALLCGSPVIVADDCGCGDIVAAHGGGRVTPLGDVSALAEAIQSILADASTWRAAARDAAAGVRATYGHDVVTDELENLYQSLVQPQHPSIGMKSERRDQRPENTLSGVSFVVPVRNGAAWLGTAIEGILLQADGRPMEVIVVDDRSSDESVRVAREFDAAGIVRVITGPGLGAAAAINTGVRAARFGIICQIDQDVQLQPNWLRAVLAELEDPQVAAAQGYYETDPNGSVFARVMGLDLEHRYAAIEGRETGHVCTGNTAYRAAALLDVGLFDESLGYGYDNDMSYRLRGAGHRLRLCRDARSRHQWREGLLGYSVQQYGYGYGRLDLVAKHPRRATGDSVSPVGMMAHPLLMALALIGFASLPWLPLFGGQTLHVAFAASAIVAGLALERLAAGIQAAWRWRNLAAILFVPVHLVRDLAWVAAIVVWLSRRLVGLRSRPENSMAARPGPSTPAPLAPRPRTPAWD